VCSKIVLVSVNSTLCDMDCNVATVIERLLQIMNCVARVVWKIKSVRNILSTEIHRHDISYVLLRK